MKLYTEEQLKVLLNALIDIKNWNEELEEQWEDCGYRAIEAINEFADKEPIELPSWISIIDSLPNPLQTVWISNGKGWTTLGCISEAEEGDDGRFYWHWCQTNGVIYQDNEEIVSECEGDDLDVLFWHPLPKPILNQNK